MPCYSPLKGWKDPETGGLRFRREKTEETFDVACGQCLGCRLDRTRMWAARITHEATLHQDNSFITLTYRPEYECTKKQLENGHHLPADWNLNKEHFQKFMKRLRKANPDKSIKYYHCGEYGNVCRHGIDLDRVKCPMCNVGRPHYHACIFGYEPSDLVLYEEGEVNRYTSPSLEKIWRYGFVDVGKLEYQSAAYTARYIMKKVTGDLAEDHYTYMDEYGEMHPVEPEYSTMSNGIGKEWYNKYKDDLYPADETPVIGQGVIHGTPRYYAEMLKQEDEEAYEQIKENRQKFREENAEEYTSERLWSKYKVKKAATANLRRDL
jgi:hypothetical protein